MQLSLLLQYGVIALAALVSAWVVANKQFPTAMRRLRLWLALPLVREGRPAWIRKLGSRIAPAATGGAGACGGCSSCGPPSRVSGKR
jgi:hypothetical protein